MNAIDGQRTVALIVAAGTGERFGGTQPKQYLPLLGRPVLAWTLSIFKQLPSISEIYTVIHPDHHQFYARAAGHLELPPPIVGGATRQESVRNGLEALARDKPDYVLIHDAVRPGFSAQLIERICAAVASADAVVPGLPVADTVRRLFGNSLRIEPREGLYAIQTPQAFKFDLILDLHRRYKDNAVTDDAALCELAGIAVAMTMGESHNFKITNSDDLTLMEHVIAARSADTLIPGRPCVHDK